MGQSRRTSSAVLHRVHQTLATRLPDRVYFALAKAFLPVVRPQRRWPKCSVTRHAQNLYEISDHTGARLFFNQPLRISRYLWPDGIQRQLTRLRNDYEHGDVRVERGDVVVDIGANIGEFSAAVSKDASRIIAIEPDPIVYGSLERNCGIYTNISPANCLISTKRERVKFYLSSLTADSSMIEPDHYTSVIELEAKPLDELLDELGVDRVDFLKVEAEGAEPEVLEGARKTLDRVRKVSVAAGPERKGEKTAHMVIPILESCGFETLERNNYVYAWRSGAAPDAG